MRLLLTGVVRRAVAAGHEIVNIDKMTYAASEATEGAARHSPRHPPASG